MENNLLKEQSEQIKAKVELSKIKKNTKVSLYDLDNYLDESLDYNVKGEVKKIGNSYFVRIPKHIIDMLEDDELELKIKNPKIQEIKKELLEHFAKQKLENRDSIPQKGVVGISYVEALSSQPTIRNLC